MSKTETSQKYGMWCYDCKEGIEVDLVNDDTARAWRELENKGKALGWGMGLKASGQAYYSCAGCSPGLYNFNVFHGHRAALSASSGRGK